MKTADAPLHPRYPLELYVVTASGFFHYQPEKHQLQVLDRRDLRPHLHPAASGQESVLEAAAVFVITGRYSRTASRYGSARSPRYVHLEAGHAAENLLLQAVALHLGAVPVGAFDDAQVSKVLSLSGWRTAPLLDSGRISTLDVLDATAGRAAGWREMWPAKLPSRRP